MRLVNLPPELMVTLAGTIGVLRPLCRVTLKGTCTTPNRSRWMLAVLTAMSNEGNGGTSVVTCCIALLEQSVVQSGGVFCGGDAAVVVLLPVPALAEVFVVAESA